MGITDNENGIFTMTLSQDELNTIYDACDYVAKLDNCESLILKAITSFSCSTLSYEMEPFQTLTNK